MSPGLPCSRCGERGAELLRDDVLAVGPVGLLFWEGRGDLKGARTRKRRPGRGPGVPVTLAGLTVPTFAFHLTTGPSFPRNMFSSVAHLARANPFNAPHLQLVYDGLAGPSSSPAGPPGPPRRSRNLAAAAVEGEARPRLRPAWRAGKDVPSPPRRGTAPSCLPENVSPLCPGLVSDP